MPISIPIRYLVSHVCCRINPFNILKWQSKFNAHESPKSTLCQYCIQKEKQCTHKRTHARTQTSNNRNWRRSSPRSILIKKPFHSVEWNRFGFWAIAGKTFVFKIQSTFDYANIRTGFIFTVSQEVLVRSFLCAMWISWSFRFFESKYRSSNYSQT